MCVMSVRVGQRSSTIAQACAHNTSTIERDVDMFYKLLRARGEHGRADSLLVAQSQLKRAYANLLELFGEFVSDEEVSTPALKHPHVDDGHPLGHERSLVEQAHHDAQVSRRFLTR
jgi:hypothetical protein